MKGHMSSTILAPTLRSQLPCFLTASIDKALHIGCPYKTTKLGTVYYRAASNHPFVGL
jgi:hypothetical protein